MNVLDRFEGGQRLMRAGLIAAAVGLIATAIGVAIDAGPALLSYLVALAYSLGIALGALFLLAIFHASNAKWPIVVRRMLEKMSLSTILFVPLFLPIAAGMKHLFLWAGAGDGLDEKTRALIEHRSGYLNIPFFLLRAAIYFAIWVVVARALQLWSERQDVSGDLSLTVKQRRLGAASLPFLGLSLTFASFDWLMSLDVTWYSTIFGVYYWAGGFVAAIALLILVTVFARAPNLYNSLVSAEHYQNLGNLLFAHVIFWAYIAFSQFLLVWIADLPEEVHWYVARTTGQWRAIAVAVAIGHFVVPFFALMPARVKRNPRTLGAVAAWVLVFHYLDVYWTIAPSLRPDSALPRWTDPTALLFIGGLAVAFTAWTLRGSYTIPVRDPYLLRSLQFRQP